MKLKNLLLAFTCSALLFSACSSDDEHYEAPGSADVPEKAKEEFHKLYKDAKDVKWETVGNYHVARFNGDITRGTTVTFSSSAWFTLEGQYCQSDQEILFDELPAIVIERFNLYMELYYAGWKIDECEVIYRPNMGLIYVIEIEKGDLERVISISEHGDILKDVLDDDDYEDVLPVIVPDDILHALEILFPADFQYLSVVEIDYDDNEITVDVMIGTKHKEIKFNLKYQWISTEYETGIKEFFEILGDNYRETKEELHDFFLRHQIDIEDIYFQKRIEVEIEDHYKFGKSISIKIRLRNNVELEIHIDKFGKITVEEDD